MKHSAIPLLVVLAVAAVCSPLQAAPFKKAEITHIVNEVAVVQPGSGERPAALKDVVQGQLGVRTGQKSRAELIFSDQTLTRLGANTIFSFESGTRNLDVQQGVVFLQVPKNAGGAVVRTAAVTAAVTGTTIMIQHIPANQRHPHGHMKVLVLEGKLNLGHKNAKGKTILESGKMVSMDDDAAGTTTPIDFDVEKLWKSLQLLDDKCSIRFEQIDKVIDRQRNLKNQGKLVDANIKG